MGTMLDVLDMTEFEEDLKDAVPCQKCCPITARPSRWLLRFGHTGSEVQHVVSYCDEHKEWALANHDLHCDQCLKGVPIPVHLISSWPI